MLKRLSYDTWETTRTNIEFDIQKVKIVQSIINKVIENKDAALRDFTNKFDGVDIKDIQVQNEEIEEAYNTLDPIIRNDLERASENIYNFHIKQFPKDYKNQLEDSCYVQQRITPIEQVGIYVPGGTAAYPSTVLMNAIPAKIAGVKRIAMISPPQKDGNISKIILAAAKIAGITEIFKVGGAQGIAALAYGTETIKPVYKIVGPGNIYVALAKREVFGKVGIDMIAGPSEILIYADDTSNPSFVAADLLSQAEHDSLAKPMLICRSEDFIEAVENELEKQLYKLPRKDMCIDSLQNNGIAILVNNDEEALTIINDIAPEHLELLNKDALALSEKVVNAGAIFLGSYSPEPLGDYIAGPNHTLPTNSTANFSSALGVYDFVKRTSIISFTKQGLNNYKDSIIRIAEREGLQAHSNAVKVRFPNEM